MAVHKTNPRLKGKLKGILVFIFSFIVGACASALLPTMRENLHKRIYNYAYESVVEIVCYDANGEKSSYGTGFYIDDGYKIVTNRHVLEGAHSVSVIFANHDEEVELGTQLYLDAERDLAILPVSRRGKPLRLAQGVPRIGDPVYVVGNPAKLARSLSHGEISGIRLIAGAQHYQTTAPISPGSSGGPLLNAQGEVLGVCTFQLRGGQNLNFAVAAKYLQTILQQEEMVSLAVLQSTINGKNAGQWYEDAYAAWETSEVSEMEKAGLVLMLLEKVFKLDPDNGQAHALSAEAYRVFGFPTKALEAYDHAARALPSQPSIYLSRGKLFKSMGEEFKALQDFSHALLLAPDTHETRQILLLRGKTYLSLGMQELACVDIHAACKQGVCGDGQSILRTICDKNETQEGQVSAMYRNIYNGMTTGDVKRILGAPAKVTTRNGHILYLYPYGSVVFQNERVVSLGNETYAGTTKSMPIKQVKWKENEQGLVLYME